VMLLSIVFDTCLFREEFDFWFWPPFLRLHGYKQYDIIPRREVGGQRVDDEKVLGCGRLLLYRSRKLCNVMVAIMLGLVCVSRMFRPAKRLSVLMRIHSACAPD